MSITLRDYFPETDEKTVIDFHLELMKEHFRLWAEINGEPYNKEQSDQALVDRAEADSYAKELREKYSKKSCRMWVLVDAPEEVPVGFLYVEIRPNWHTGKLSGVINEIYIDPNYQGRRLSSQLIKEGEAWFREEGISRREVFCTSNNLAAVKLYASFGYKVADYRMTKWDGTE
ncbi:acetyltransferase (GNAT) family protein [Scopulibacillus darangshiensis]|uniref:Acetyltransferase (GNAT) family protein n=1 Tax=Scopulibacillus darangshiensis TaxID=442528 RepID=A0A4R2PAY6_9BACL|nr:GNAT family N-acetyltransferase [Scopulibacillus darangshiensis]TCP31271.1 acetyltransferase (GNAT) family protein [Scopulibacillus darangshiensis]